MKSQDELYDLIHALNKHEKKLVTQNAGVYDTGKNKLYMQLFNVLNDMEEYDEELIFKKIRDPQFRKNYGVTKHYLFNFILRSLRQMETEEDSDREMTAAISDLQLVISKGLVKGAARMLKSLKEEASDNNHFLHLLRLLSLERVMVYMAHDATSSAEVLEKLLEEETKIWNLQVINQKLVDLNLLLQDYIYLNQNQSSAQIQEGVRKIWSQLPDLAWEEINSFRIRISYYRFHLSYYGMIGDTDKNLYWSQQFLHYVQTAQMPERDRKRWLNVAVNSCLGIHYYRCDFAPFESLLALLKDNVTKSAFNESEREHCLVSYSLVYHTYHFDEQQLTDAVAAYFDYVKRYRNYLNNEFLIFMKLDLAYAMIKLNRLDESMQVLNELSDLVTEVRKDMVGHVKILSLILHYQLKNTDYLPYLLRNTYRFFTKYEHTTNVHREILSFIRDMLKYTQGSDLKMIFKKHLEAMETAKAGMQNGEIPVYLVFSDFLRSKVQ